MKDEGFGSRDREGRLRARAANIAEMQGPALEGPGAEQRLKRIQRRFRHLADGGNRRRVPECLWLGLGVFVLVVAVGLLTTYVLPRLG